MIAASDCHGLIPVHCASPPYYLLCQKAVWQRTGNANFVPSGDFPKTAFWLLQMKAAELTTEPTQSRTCF